VVRKLREAGAVLIAKLATGELALDDRWFGGQTKNPWNLAQGSSGSSAGPAAATSAGLVGFSVGTETRGSIVSPSSRCGATGCKPSFGRVSRHGVMAVSWTLDKVGPICRAAEDCAIVLKAVAGADDNDMATVDIPFNWDAEKNVRGFRVGMLNSNVSTADQEPYSVAIQVLESLGCTIVPINFPQYPAAEIVATIRADDAAAFDELTRSKRDAQLVNQLPADRPNAFRMARLIPAVEYLQAHRVRGLMMKDVARIMETVNVLILPQNDPSASIHNLTGQPEVSVPSGFRGRWNSDICRLCRPGLRRS
jgi:Asp-tRNA(Asn)/Glu-tRNA(Gln) amidotransferase A subunit family amidase